MIKRQRFKQTENVEDRCAREALELRESAKLLPPGTVRDAALRRARQMETAAHMSEWLRSPGLQPPTGPNVPKESHPDDTVPHSG